MNFDKDILDIYADYIITALGKQVTATELSLLLNGTISNDKISRFLGGVYQKDKILQHSELTSKELWGLVKSSVRKYETEDSCIVIDDTIQEKQYSDENDIICWHFDHCEGRNVKGVNLLNFLLCTPEVNIPIALEVVKKTEEVIKIVDDKEIRTCKSKVTKNEMAQNQIIYCIENAIKFRHFLFDIWFASNQTLELIHSYGKKYVVPIKKNRKIVFSHKDKLKGNWKKIESLSQVENQIIENTPTEVWLEGLNHSVLLIKQVFTNKDGSTGIQFLITNDFDLDTVDKIKQLYQKRWQVEEYHKSLKSNLSLAKAPTKTVFTGINHFFCCAYSFLKLELLTKATKVENHFQLKNKLYFQAMQSATKQLALMRAEFGCER